MSVCLYGSKSNEKPKGVMSFETFDQSDEETWSYQNIDLILKNIVDKSLPFF